MKHVVRTGALLRVHFAVVNGDDLENPVHWDFTMERVTPEALAALFSQIEAKQLEFSRQLCEEALGRLTGSEEPVREAT